MSTARYEVGCAGQFMLGMTSTYEDVDVAIVACEHGPPGCEVFDREAGEWIGPGHLDEIEEAKARLAARDLGA